MNRREFIAGTLGTGAAITMAGGSAKAAVQGDASAPPHRMDLTIVCSQPGHGKTAFALNMIGDHRCAILSPVRTIANCRTLTDALAYPADTLLLDDWVETVFEKEKQHTIEAIARKYRKIVVTMPANLGRVYDYERFLRSRRVRALIPLAYSARLIEVEVEETAGFSEISVKRRVFFADVGHTSMQEAKLQIRKMLHKQATMVINRL